AGTVSDPENSARTVTVVWGDSTPNTVVTLPAGTLALNVAHQYLNDGPTGGNSFAYPVSVTAAIAGSATTTANTSVTVNNVAPKLSKIGDGKVDEGTTVSRAVTFTDPGSQDHFTYSVNWGDGTVQGPTSTTAKSFVINHTYADDGLYNAVVTVL